LSPLTHAASCMLSLQVAAERMVLPLLLLLSCCCCWLLLVPLVNVADNCCYYC